MERLIDGVSRFRRDIYPAKKQLFERLAKSQSPDTLFITCADSRIVPDLITQSEPGDLFICRNAGNMVPPYGELNGGITATIEYAVGVLNVEHIVVCGHTDCGAVKGLLKPETLTDLPTVQRWLSYGELAKRMVKENYPDLDEEATLKALTHENVLAQLDHLRTHPTVAARLARGKIRLHGWVYEIPKGEVHVWDAEKRVFVSIENYGDVDPIPRARLALAAD